MPRPVDHARTTARRSGAVTYDGTPCGRGHGGSRYVSTGACLDCVKARDSDREPRRKPERAADLFAELLG